jgi:hypothetical protein
VATRQQSVVEIWQHGPSGCSTRRVCHVVTAATCPRKDVSNRQRDATAQRRSRCAVRNARSISCKRQRGDAISPAPRSGTTDMNASGNLPLFDQSVELSRCRCVEIGAPGSGSLSCSVTQINKFGVEPWRFRLLDRFCAVQLRFRARFLQRFFELCEELAKSGRDRSDNAEIVGDTFLQFSAIVILSRAYSRLNDRSNKVALVASFSMRPLFISGCGLLFIAGFAACTEFSLESDL